MKLRKCHIPGTTLFGHWWNEETGRKVSDKLGKKLSEKIYAMQKRRDGYVNGWVLVKSCPRCKPAHIEATGRWMGDLHGGGW